MSGSVRRVVHAGGKHAGLRVPEVDQRHVKAFGGVVVGLGARGEECLDVADDAGQQADEAEFLTESSAGLLFGVGCLVEGEGDGEGGVGFAEVGDVVDERVLGADGSLPPSCRGGCRGKSEFPPRGASQLWARQGAVRRTDDIIIGREQC
ncbi:hypothetical protein ACWD1Z_34380 [Streptomyces sp. NPDC002784]